MQDKLPVDTPLATIEAGMREAFRRLVEETKLRKSYLVFSDRKGGVIQVDYDELDAYLAQPEE